MGYNFIPFNLQTVLSFCVVNAMVRPVAKQRVNEAITQQVSYARRKLQRAEGLECSWKACSYHMSI